MFLWYFRHSKLFPKIWCWVEEPSIQKVKPVQTSLAAYIDGSRSIPMIVYVYFLQLQFTCQIHQSISSTFVFSFLILVIKLFIILNIRFYPNSVYTCLTNLKATSFQKKIFLLIQIKQHNLTGKKITFCLGFTIILQINGWQFI